MTNEANAILEHILTQSPIPTEIGDVEAWWSGHRRVGAGVSAPIHRAILGGFCADRLGYAFASGYREALCCAIAGVGERKLALCASEAKGAHPRFIETRLDRADRAPGDERASLTLSGVKHYATLGQHADGYIVIASVGRAPDGKNRLAAVHIPSGRAGVTLTDLPPTPFVPELPHARIAFEQVTVDPDDVLPGDGYAHYLKPFRTIEDMHVFAAACAWLVQVGRRSNWPQAVIEGLVAALMALAGLADVAGTPADAGASAEPSTVMAPILAPATHIALAGVITLIRRAIADAEPYWTQVDQDTQDRWRRDQPLLGIASKARARRREVAWENISVDAARQRVESRGEKT